MTPLFKSKTAFFVLVFTVLWQSGFATDSNEKTNINLNREYSFEKNIGQFPQEVLYTVKLQNYSGYLTKNGFVVTWRNSKESSVKNHDNLWSFGLNFSEEYPGKPFEIGNTDYRVNYIRGTKKIDWILNAPHYKKIRYPEVYKGIDIEFYIRNNKIEFDYIIRPYTDPSDIGFTINGAENISLNTSGNIEVAIADNKYVIQSPIAYQEINGSKKFIAANYIIDNNTIKLSLGNYNNSYTLVVDPSAFWASIVGGVENDFINDVKYNRNTDDIYITGWTKSDDFPLATEEGVNISYGNAFITKLSNFNGQPLFTTIISGTGSFFSEGNSIAFDENDTIYVAGKTFGYGFYATEGAYQIETTDEDKIPTSSIRWEEQSGDAFVMKFSPDGSQLLSSTLLGGSKGDKATSVSINSQNEVIITGYTFSNDFPKPNAFDYKLEGDRQSGGITLINPDGFVAKFNNDLSSLVFSSYIGGIHQEYLYDLAIGNNDDIYIAGRFERPYTLPLSPKYSISEGRDVFNFDAVAVKISNEGSFDYVTILSGSKDDKAYGLELDNAGNIYLTGVTKSSNFPVTPGAYQTNLVGPVEVGDEVGDAFLSKIKAGGRECIYSTYLGGSNIEEAFDVKVNGLNQAAIVGYTKSPDFPTEHYYSPPQDGYSHGYNSNTKDGFAAKFSEDGKDLLYSSYLGGTSDETLTSCDFDRWDDMLIVAGNLSSKNFFDVVSFLDKGYDETPNFLYHGYDGLISNLRVFSYRSNSGSTSDGSVYYDGPFIDYHIDPVELIEKLCNHWPCINREEFAIHGICLNGDCNESEGAYFNLLTTAADAWVANHNKLNYQLNYSAIKENTASLLAGPIFKNEIRMQLLDSFKKIANNNSPFPNPDTLLNALNRAYLQMVFRDYTSRTINLDSLSQVSFTEGIKLYFWKGANNPKHVKLQINDGLEQIPKDFVALYPYYSFSFESSEPLTDLIDVQMDIDLSQSVFLSNVSNPRIMEWNGKIFRDITRNYNKQAQILTGRTDRFKTYLILEYVGEKQVSIQPEQNKFINCQLVWYLSMFLALMLLLILTILIINKFRRKS